MEVHANTASPYQLPQMAAAFQMYLQEKAAVLPHLLKNTVLQRLSPNMSE